MKIKNWFIMITVGLAVLAGCSKPEADEYEMIGKDLSSVKTKALSPDAKSVLLSEDEFPSENELCGYSEYDLIAGRTNDIGDVLIGNDGTSLYIKIISEGGFRDVGENIKIWMGKEMIFTERPPAGQFPYKFTVDASDTYFIVSFTLEELEISCEDQLYIIIHVDAPEGETAFAGIPGEMQSGKAWWYYIHHSLGCCDNECTMAATTQVTDVLCNGSSTGAIDLTVTGGTAPLAFLWSNEAVTEDLSGVPAGVYSVTITDAEGCVVTVSSIVVDEPDAIEIEGNLTNISCEGNDGAIDLTITGGTPPYAILWNDEATSEDRSGLSEGVYSVTVVDVNQCQASARFTLTNECYTPDVIHAFGRKTYEPMVYCFMELDLDNDGSMDFDTWGWTNGAMSENVTSVRTYKLYTNASDCDVSNAEEVGKVSVSYSGGIVSATYELFNGYKMSSTAMYVGNDILPKDGGVYTTDPSKYPYQHNGLGAADTDTYNITGLSGQIYIIVYAGIVDDGE